MYSNLKPEDPFDFSPLHCSTCTCFARRRFHLHVKLRSDFFVMSLQLILMITEKFVMADLRNWTKV